MRLILEKEEIVAILSKHFDAELDPTKVVIRTDPLEIEVCGLPLSSNSRAEPVPPTPPVARYPVNEVVVVPPAEEETEEGNASPAAVLAASKALEAQLERENPKAKRRSGAYSLVPPPISPDEM